MRQQSGDFFLSCAARLFRFLVVIAFISIAACANPARKAQVEPEYTLAPSSDRFWRHILEGEEKDWFKLLNTGEQAFRWRLAMLDSAHQSIDMESFLWKPDQSGMQVLAHVLAAADRGVRVRILLDDSFTYNEDLILHRIDLHPNIELRIYNPYKNRSQSMVGRTVFNLGDFSRVNHRLHNKTLTVDAWAVAVGGRNLANEYFGLHTDHNFRDMEILAMGDSVAMVSTHFDNFWNSGWSFPVDQIVDASSDPRELQALRDELASALGEVHISSEAELVAAWQEAAHHAVAGRARFLSDDPALEDPALESEEPSQLARHLVRAIGSANEEVLLVSAYLVPTPELSAVLEQVLQRGVRVKILTNSMRSNNHLSAHAAYQGYVRKLLESGVELFEMRTDAADRNIYMRSPMEDKELGLHAKFMLLDSDRVFIGSSNLDPRSLKLNTEVGLMIESEALNQQLRQVIDVDFLPRNSWSVRLEEGEVVWVSDHERLKHPPADSIFQRLEEWFIGLLPIESQM